MNRPGTKTPERLAKVESDFRALEAMVRGFCAEVHETDDGLCMECAGLLAYARRRLENCPHDPKPPCKDCPRHCFAPSRREQVRRVMRQGATRMIKRAKPKTDARPDIGM